MSDPKVKMFENGCDFNMHFRLLVLGIKALAFWLSVKKEMLQSALGSIKPDSLLRFSF